MTDVLTIRQTHTHTHVTLYSRILLKITVFLSAQVHYQPGKTPLVGWIKGYMVPELMDIPVCDELMEQMPSDYGGMKTYLKKTYDRVEKLKKADEDKLRAELENMVDGDN